MLNMTTEIINTVCNVTISLVHQLPGGRLITLDHFQHGRNVMFLLEYTLTLDYGSAFPEWNASAKTIIHGLVVVF